MLTVSPREVDIEGALRTFLISALPAGVDAILGQVNRVPEPSNTDYVVFWPIRRRRLATNENTWLDCTFTAMIGTIAPVILPDMFAGGAYADMTYATAGPPPITANTTMTVSAIGPNNGLPLRPGAIISGPTVVAGTVIIKQLSGSPPGGVGTYQVSPSQTAGTQEVSAGGATFLQQTEVTYQIDVHSANVGDSSDMAQVISTMLRDAYAVQIMQTSNPGVVPLYAGDPRQVPFINAEDQYETRWIIEAILQANQIVVGAPTQFADSADLTVVDAEVVPVVGGDSWSDGFSDGFGG